MGARTLCGASPICSIFLTQVLRCCTGIAQPTPNSPCLPKGGCAEAAGRAEVWTHLVCALPFQQHLLAPTEESTCRGTQSFTAAKSQDSFGDTSQRYTLPGSVSAPRSPLLRALPRAGRAPLLRAPPEGRESRGGGVGTAGAGATYKYGCGAPPAAPFPW